jgi:SAM-dependent methyltransferase
MSIPMNEQSNPAIKEFWENLYQSQCTPWDLGTFSPPFKTFLDSPYAVPPAKIAVIGCGKGNECLLFAKYGFEVTGIDFAPSAIKSTREKFEKVQLLGTKGFVLERDIFDLHDYDHSFDYVLEHTCFCALHPSRRRNYAFAVRDLLKPGGKLIALWWLLERDNNGPPYALDRTELFEIFNDLFSFDIVHQPTDSVAGRKNQELFAFMTVK